MGHMECQLSSGHAALVNEWERTKKELSRFWSCVGACDTLLYLGYRLVLVLCGVFFVSRGEMSFGDIFTFLTLSGTFMSFVWDFQMEAYRNAVAAAEKILEFWRMPRERTTGSAFAWQEDAPVVHVQKVSFSYQGNEKILRNVSFEVGRGELFGIVGESGCGKTTLMNLLCGFAEPDDGTMEIGGIPAEAWNLNAMRSQMGYMQQKTTLIKGSIYENVALMDERELTEEQKAEICCSLDAVGLGFLCQAGKEHDLSTLSQGELQRVGFARCLFKKAELWLLDEPTSALDSENEQEILRLMKAFRKQGVTQVVVTHRPQVADAMDRCIRLTRSAG